LIPNSAVNRMLIQKNGAVTVNFNVRAQGAQS